MYGRLISTQLVDQLAKKVFMIMRLPKCVVTRTHLCKLQCTPGAPSSTLYCMDTYKVVQLCTMYVHAHAHTLKPHWQLLVLSYPITTFNLQY